MKITTKREPHDRRAVLIDGRDIGLSIVKGEPPRYREPQDWHVVIGEDYHDPIITAPSLHGCLSRLERLASILA